MSATKSGSNLRQIKAWQRDAARAEYLRHPDSSISQVAKATGVAARTVARAREALVKEGLLTPGRNAAGATAADAVVLAQLAKEAAGTTGEESAPYAPAEGPPETDKQPLKRSEGAATVDGEALRQMNEMLDSLADEDDETTRKRMLRQVKRFAFDPNLHPDTRMSASTLWAKLLDIARAKDLGPGIPVTLAAAIERATDFLRVCGPKVAVPAFYAAFDLGEAPTNGKQSTQAVEQGEPAPAPVLPAGPTDHDPEVRNEA